MPLFKRLFVWNIWASGWEVGILHVLQPSACLQMLIPCLIITPQMCHHDLDSIFLQQRNTYSGKLQLCSSKVSVHFSVGDDSSSCRECPASSSTLSWKGQSFSWFCKSKGRKHLVSKGNMLLEGRNSSSSFVFCQQIIHMNDARGSLRKAVLLKLAV